MADNSKMWNMAKKAISKSNPLLGTAINVAEGLYKGINPAYKPVTDCDPDLEYVQACLSELKGKPKCYTDEYSNEKIFKKFTKKFNIQDSEKIFCIIDETAMLVTEGVIFTDVGMHTSIMTSGKQFFLSYKELYNSEIDANYGIITSTIVIVKDDIKYKIDLTEKNCAKLLYNVLSRIQEYAPPVDETLDNNGDTAVTFKDNELGYAGMLRTFLSQGNVENNRSILNNLMVASNISVERAKEIEEIIKSQSFKDNELGYVGMLKSFIEQGNLEQNRQLLVTLANSSNISSERAKEIENIICNT